VHRDLKPENVFLNSGGQLKVLDFGIARLREMGDTTSATKTGAIMGTPTFMAPEQARGRWDEVDGRTDLWAVGATMYTLITGRYVHEAETVNETLALAMIQPARPIQEVAPDLPRPVAKLIDKALAYSMHDRFQDAAFMQEAVRLVYHRLTEGGGGRASELSAPDDEELGAAATVRSDPNLQGGEQDPLQELGAVSGPGGTVPALTRTSPGTIPTVSVSRGALIAIVGIGALLVGGVILARSLTSPEPSVTFPSAPPPRARQPQPPLVARSAHPTVTPAGQAPAPVATKDPEADDDRQNPKHAARPPLRSQMATTANEKAAPPKPKPSPEPAEGTEPASTPTPASTVRLPAFGGRK
jgi:hypothetical protein